MTKLLVFLCLVVMAIGESMASRKLQELVVDNPNLLKYHNGPLLRGKVAIDVVWYGNFKPSQKAIVTDFVASLASPVEKTGMPQPSVAAWWKTTDKYFNKSRPLVLSLGKQIVDERYSVGKSLSQKQIAQLASANNRLGAITVILTSSDVTVAGQCSICGKHGSVSTRPVSGRRYYKTAFIWVGNSESQCPGQCAWPFHQPIYGPQSPPLVAPNNDVGLDGMIINFASLLAGTATNPFGNGFFQGPANAPLEAASACPGIYAKGAYPGYAGDLLVDKTTGASYNANGVNGRKYLVPALYDPSTSTCYTVV